MSSLTYQRGRAAKVRDGSEGEGKGADQPFDRALAVLDAVLSQRGPVTATSVAEATGLPLATAHRLVGQLESRALLKRALGSKKLLPGSRLVDLGTKIMRAVLVADGTHVLLARLAAKLEEHCHIGIVSDMQVLYVDSARSTRRSGLLFEPGQQAPIYCTSIGKTFLATLPLHDLTRCIEDIQLTPHTVRTIVAQADLLREVDRVRERGWAASNEEFTAGVVGCAVPLLTPDGSFLAGLGVSVPAVQCPFDDIGRFVPDLLACAAAIGAELLE